MTRDSSTHTCYQVVWFGFWRAMTLLFTVHTLRMGPQGTALPSPIIKCVSNAASPSCSVCARAMNSLASADTIRHLKRAIKRELAVTSHPIGRAVRPIYCVSELRHHTSGIIPARYQTRLCALLRHINFVQHKTSGPMTSLPHASSAEKPLAGKISLWIREGKNCELLFAEIKFFLAYNHYSSRLYNSWCIKNWVIFSFINIKLEKHLRFFNKNVIKICSVIDDKNYYKLLDSLSIRLKLGVEGYVRNKKLNTA